MVKAEGDPRSQLHRLSTFPMSRESSCLICTNCHSSSSSSSCYNNNNNNNLRNRGIGGCLSFGRSELIHPMASPKQWKILVEKGITVPIIGTWFRMLVPEALHAVRPQAYSPQFLFIGPQNDRSSRDALSFMQHCRALCVTQFLARCESTPELDSLKARLVGEDENPDCDMDTLALQLAIDAVFVLDFMCFMDGNAKLSFASNIWKEYFNILTLNQMQRDLFIVGNQVPLSILVSLASFEGLTEDEFAHVLHRMIWECNPFTSHCRYDDSKQPVDDTSLLTCENLLHCLYQACVKNSDDHRIPKASSTNNSRERVPMKPRDRIPRASLLRQFGVEFKAVNGNATTIRYNEKNLKVELPKLVVDDGTECKLRNLVAYELTSNCNKEWDICSYVMIMDSLIDNTDDLEILYNAGVLQSQLGSDEKMIAMWNEMRVNIQVPYTKRQDDLTRAIMTAYKTNWRKIWVEGRRRFFSRPWYTLSAIAAVLLLLMTALQTVYTIIGFYKV